MTDRAASLLEPDYAAAFQLLPESGHKLKVSLPLAIDAACKPLYDRIAELEAVVRQRESRVAHLEEDRALWRRTAVGDQSRIDQLLRDLAAIKAYLTDNGSPWQNATREKWVLDMVRAAQRGDTP